MNNTDNKIKNCYKIACAFINGIVGRFQTFCKSVSPAMWFYIASVIVMMLPIYILYANIDAHKMLSLIIAFSDAVLILIPYWWIKRRRWLTLIPVWLSAIFVEVNLLMLKWSGELMSFHSIYMTGNVEGAVTSNIPSLITFSNIVILLITILYTIFYFIFRKKINSHRFDKRVTVKGIVISLCVFTLVQCGMQYRWYREHRHMGVSLTSVSERVGGLRARRNLALIHKGYPIYVLTSVVNMFESRNLSEDQKQMIVSYIENIPISLYNDSIFAENRGKNLIIILVESLNSYAINEKIAGNRVMPFLHSLINEEGTISNLNVVSQIKDGMSSDGQLITNIGLLPLREGTVSLEYGTNTRFIGLSEILKDYKSIAIFGEAGKLWGEMDCYKAYGFDEIVTSLDYAGAGSADDSELLECAASKIPSFKQPYFLECVTMAMHAPFDMVDTPMEKFLADSSIDERKKKYFHACRNFDNALSNFVRDLKNNGQWDDTVLMVMSDHSIFVDEPDGEARFFANIPMAFVAANTGVSKKIDKIAGQIDLFPTIIDIMGYSEEPVGEYLLEGKKMLWRGLGQSMLSPDYKGGAVDPRGVVHGDPNKDNSARMEESYEVSYNIIRGDWFRGK